MRSLAATGPHGTGLMNDQDGSTGDQCPRCDGTGVSRDAKQFFYGICLIAAGFIAFFQWPPVPAVFTYLEQLSSAVGLPDWLGSVVMWSLTCVPPLLGVILIGAWLRPGVCTYCAAWPPEDVHGARGVR